MDTVITQISVDWSLITRVLIAHAFGWAYGYWLHRTRDGQEFERRYTYLATILGIGVDLAIAFPGDWFTVSAVISSSAIGIVVLAMIYGYPDDRFAKYRVKHALEDAIAGTMDIRAAAESLLKNGSQSLPAGVVAKLGQVLASANETQRLIAEARSIAKGIKD